MPSQLAVFSPNYAPAICGVGDHSAKVIQYLPPQVIGCILTGTEHAKALHVEVYLPDKKSSWLVKWCTQQPKGLMLLWQYSPYSLHVRGIPWWVVAAMWRLRKVGVQQAIFFHEVKIRYNTPGLFNKWRAFQQKLIANICAFIVGGKIATSIPLYQSYFLSYKPTLIPIGANLLPIKGIDTVPWRIVGFANRIYPWLIEALTPIQLQYPKVEILWIGRFENSQSIQDVLKSVKLNCHFTGPLSACELSKTLQSAALVLLPQPISVKGEGGISLKNGTLSAALAMGKPILATAGDMTELDKLVNGQVLHLLDKNDVFCWQQGIQQLLEDQAYSRHLSAGALAFYQAHLRWEVLVPKVWGLFKTE